MRGIWFRRLIPASIVGLVLAFSYFAPALGVDVAPVKSHGDANCGRFGYGYHGGKHNFVCPTHPPAVNPDVVHAAPAVKVQAPAVKNQAPATPPGTSATNQRPALVTVPATKSLVDIPVSVGVSQWRSFAELVLRQLS